MTAWKLREKIKHGLEKYKILVISEEFGAIERPKGITFDGVIDSIKAAELPLLSDEDIIQLVTDYHISGVQNRHVLAKNVAQAQRDADMEQFKGEGKNGN